MPLKVHCVGCGVELVLHDAFAGASCRCGHCRALMDVPAAAAGAASASRSTARPAHPRLAHGRLPTAGKIGTKSPRIAKAAAAAPHAAWFGTAWLKVGLFAALLAGGTGAYLATRPAPPTEATAVVAVPVTADEEDAAFVPGVAPALDEIARQDRRQALRLAMRTYFGQPTSPQRVAWVIDGGLPMAQYFDSVSAVTKMSILHLRSKDQSYGVFMAAAHGTKAQPIGLAEAEGYLATRDLLDRFSPGGSADVGLAFAEAARQRPDAIFLVVAHPLDRPQIREMRRQALAVGVTVNVVALGDAGRGIGQLASATSGAFTALTPDQVGGWARFVASMQTLRRLEKEFLTH